jgi:hypothetical protein
MKPILFLVFLFTSSYAWSQQIIDSIDTARVPVEQKQKNEIKFILLKTLPLIAVGTIGTFSHKIINRYEFKEERDEIFYRFHTRSDNYLQYAPALMTFGMDAMGFKGKHSIKDQAFLFVKSELVMEAMIFPLKKISSIMRPDSSAHSSFPSGHTAQAFMGAELLRKEYGADHPLLAIGGYAVASMVGAMRVLNNKHWVTDVLAGAGIGILSTDIIYWMDHRKNLKSSSRVMALPTLTSHGAGFYLSYHLGKDHS